MSIQNILEYKQDYPLYGTIRIKHTTLDRRKARSKEYGESIDDIVGRLLDKLERMKCGGKQLDD